MFDKIMPISVSVFVTFSQKKQAVCSILKRRIFVVRLMTYCAVKGGATHHENKVKGVFTIKELKSYTN